MTELEKIRANADLVLQMVREHFRADATFDGEAVRWLDGHINRMRDRAQRDEEFRARLTSMYGSFLGECIARTYGGEWLEREEGWAVTVQGTNRIDSFPLNKVAKQFDNGESDSIHSFFTAIPLLARGPDAKMTIPRVISNRPWWRFW